MKVIITLASFLFATGIWAQENQQRDGEAIAALMKITKYLADSDIRCAKVDDCKVIPVGSRACGGPSGYVVTSALNGNMPQLEYLSQQTEIKQATYNRTYNVMSICSLISPPDVKCVANYCR